MEGAANYRQVPLIAGEADPTEDNEHYVYGTGWVSTIFMSVVFH